jgi:hypothetical protein
MQGFYFCALILCRVRSGMCSRGDCQACLAARFYLRGSHVPADSFTTPGGSTFFLLNILLVYQKFIWNMTCL